MAVDVIPKRLQRVWDKSNIRVSVLASLFLQILLIFLAPSRKCAKGYRGYFITIILWSAYLLADFFAAYAIGLISNGQGDECDKSNANAALSAFWAPFLLLHLGGPDSITAFALEDNELWIRHLFGLIAELTVVAYVFAQATPFPLWLPTVLVLFVGVIKYAERTHALHLACLDSFGKGLMKEAQTTPMASLKEADIVQVGFHFYKVFRKLVVENMLSLQELHYSRDFFLELKALKAFRVMEVELNFMYDALFTKFATVHGSYLWYIFRFICTALIAASFILFKSHHKPHDIHPLDIAITNSLLIVAIILEIISLIRLVFSDWTVALPNSRKTVIPIYKIHNFISFPCRWSNSMAQYNLISLCLKRRIKLWDKVVEFFGLKEIYEELMYTKFIHVENNLKTFIFDKLEEKARFIKERATENQIKGIYSSKGDWALKKYTTYPILKAHVGESKKFEVIVLIWHMATDFLYYKDTSDNFDDVDTNNHQDFCKILWDYIHCLRQKKRYLSSDHVDHKKLCKILSDYMLYLIVQQPSLISVIPATSRIWFQDTYKEIKAAVGRFQDTHKENKKAVGSQEMNETDLFNKLLSEIDSARQVRIGSLLIRACTIAKELENWNDVRMWEMMSEVWVELLCYGASHSRGYVHAQQLSKGGELVTFVWLLIAHFQLRDGLIQEFTARAG